MTNARKGDLVIAKVRHTYTMRHGPTEYTFTYAPCVVNRSHRDGKISSATNMWGSPVVTCFDVEWLIVPSSMLNGRSVVEVMAKLAKEYDSLAEVKQAVREALAA